MSSTLPPNDLADQLLASKAFFERSTGILDEAHSEFCPRQGMMTVAQQVAHTAHTVDWFIEGVSRPEGFDLDFETQAEALAGVTSLAAARQMLERAYTKAIHFIRSRSPEDLARPLPPAPSWAVNPSAASCGPWSSTPHTTAAP